MLVEAPLLAPVEVTIDEDHKKAIELETAQAAEMALPEDDEEFWTRCGWDRQNRVGWAPGQRTNASRVN